MLQLYVEEHNKDSLISLTISQTHLILIIFLKQTNKETKTMAEGALFHLAGKVLELLRSFTHPEVKLAFGVQTEILKTNKHSFHNPSCDS